MPDSPTCHCENIRKQTGGEFDWDEFEELSCKTNSSDYVDSTDYVLRCKVCGSVWEMNLDQIPVFPKYTWFEVKRVEPLPSTSNPNFDLACWLVPVDSSEFSLESGAVGYPFVRNIQTDSSYFDDLFSQHRIGFFRAIGRSEQATQALQQLAETTGQFVRAELPEEERFALWLRYPGDIDLKRPRGPGLASYIAINPRPIPELFDCDTTELYSLELRHRDLEFARKSSSSAGSYENRFDGGASDVDIAEALVRSIESDLRTRISDLRISKPAVIDVWAALQIKRCEFGRAIFADDDDAGMERHVLDIAITQWNEVRAGNRFFADEPGLIYVQSTLCEGLWQAFGF